METINAIKERRSIRKFQDKMIAKETIQELLELSIKAPSGKNRQPWRFVVLQGKKKDELVNLMTNVAKILKEKGTNIGSFEISINSINEAPVVILVFNGFSNFEEDYNHYRLLTDTQSIGASIQTMILAAQDLGLGSLWICDIFYSQKEICSWLNRKDELVAAVAIGYVNQSPYPRPRKPWREVTEWMS
ncbi:nitroreductase [Clostridium botulinum]|uniref:nitroreductase family protein n=1 Tax=Clostridium botulinum TaxID=1491 RepID=UPI00035BADF3|nr:nitroreductase [Clostridium botulinum]AJD26926.1 nitroreductase family protein [Clostridium botulinum CDC_297]EPS52121.1 nitroreductase [Clostridium botulinum A1 str. CFSAN002368]AUN03674.1 nitroreductase [Clostridium botulinum]MBN3397585.1 nitroreductase [Clostridium botulinum]MBN3412647.1 nitroreductase [Clostridium botulinum]